MTVWITRPQPDAAEFAAQCREMGINAYIDPLFTIETLALSPEHAALAGQADLWIVTSHNALPVLPRNFSDKKLICVGGATTARARAMGFANAVCGGETVADLILFRIRNVPDPKLIFYFRGDVTKTDLQMVLSQQGCRVVEAVCYTATPVTKLSETTIKLLENNIISVVTLFSARASEAFLGLTENLPRPRTAVCLSRAVAEPLQDARIDTRWPDAPNVPALLTLLQHTLNTVGNAVLPP